jgi:succinate dehydrogenase / fumarate reductase cytochrome b subunit
MQLQHFIGGTATENPYELVAMLFRQPAYAVMYLVWIGAIWFHLTHGFWSAFQTVGVNNGKWLPRLQTLAKIYATLVAVGFASIPLFFLLGLDK